MKAIAIWQANNLLGEEEKLGAPFVITARALKCSPVRAWLNLAKIEVLGRSHIIIKSDPFLIDSDWQFSFFFRASSYRLFKIIQTLHYSAVVYKKGSHE